MDNHFDVLCSMFDAYSLAGGIPCWIMAACPYLVVATRRLTSGCVCMQRLWPLVGTRRLPELVPPTPEGVVQSAGIEPATRGCFRRRRTTCAACSSTTWQSAILNERFDSFQVFRDNVTHIPAADRACVAHNEATGSSALRLSIDIHHVERRDGAVVGK